MTCRQNLRRLPSAVFFHVLSLAVPLFLALGSLQAESPAPAKPDARQLPTRKPWTANPPKIDPSLSVYSPSAELTGTLSAAGADALSAILEGAAAEFSRHHPKFHFLIKGKGGATALPQLIEDTVDFGMMTRPFTADEMSAYVKRRGHEPTFLLVAWEVLGVYVHQDNPITSLTLPQLDAIYSHERRRGHPTDLAQWGQLGLDRHWSDRPISLHGPSTASRIYGLFISTALGRGRPKTGYIEHAGQGKLLQAISENIDSIGFCSARFRTAGVRVVPIVTHPGGMSIPPESSLAAEGKYPLAQPLYLVISKKPGQPLAPLPAEFLRFLYGRSGQVIISQEGYTPMSAPLAQRELQKAGLSP